MNFIQVIVGIGVTMGIVAILAAVVAGKVQTRLNANRKEPDIPHTIAGRIGGSPIFNPGAFFARLGQNKPARMSLDMVIMTPTFGFRFFNLAGTALLLFLIWGPTRDSITLGIYADLLISGLFSYLSIYVAAYEARYDSEMLSVPNLLFQEKRYAWEDFNAIRQDGSWIYRLQFEGGTAFLQKYLVGMPTFLTFVSDIGEMNKRH